MLDIRSNSYFMDRDGELFKFVLQFLRESDLYLPDGFNQWEALKREAEYWELNDMARIINRIERERQETKEKESVVIIDQRNADDQDALIITGQSNALRAIWDQFSNELHEHLTGDFCSIDLLNALPAKITYNKVVKLCLLSSCL